MSQTQLELALEGPVARMVFRSSRGVPVVTRAVRAQLDEALGRLEQEDSWRVLVLSCEGRSWLAGGDVAEMQQFDAARALAFSREGQKRAERLAGLRGVTVAAIHAPCFGGGTELSLACDLRLLSAEATLCLPEVRLGVVPAWGGSVRCAARLGTAVARRLILTGRPLTAEAALRCGLADEVFPSESFVSEVDAFVSDLLAAGPESLRIAAQLLDSYETGTSPECLEAEARAFAACFSTGDPGEGMLAFLEKRPASWR